MWDAGYSMLDVGFFWRKAPKSTAIVSRTWENARRRQVSSKATSFARALVALRPIGQPRDSEPEFAASARTISQNHCKNQLKSVDHESTMGGFWAQQRLFVSELSLRGDTHAERSEPPRQIVNRWIAKEQTPQCSMASSIAEMCTLVHIRFWPPMVKRGIHRSFDEDMMLAFCWWNLRQWWPSPASSPCSPPSPRRGAPARIGPVAALRHEKWAN
jgi:hypothetical protein